MGYALGYPAGVILAILVVSVVVGRDWPGRNDDDFPAIDYSVWFERCKDEARRVTAGIELPYNPVVPMGWDVSPRTVQSDMYDKRDYPFDVVVTGNTPELYEQALRHIDRFMRSTESTGSMIHLPCWNEWTEGAYLEPDTKYGYGFLEAIKRVFGVSREKAMAFSGNQADC